jgi:hypothetical protein
VAVLLCIRIGENCFCWLIDKYTLQNDHFYLCIRKILFVAQIIPLRGTFFCATNKILQIHGAKEIAVLPPDNCKNPM